MTVGALDETGQEKAGEATAGVKRQYMGSPLNQGLWWCAARVIGTASPANHEYLRSLPAEPVAYGEGLVMNL